MKRISIIVILLTLCFAVSYSSAETDISGISYMTEEYPPFNFTKDGRVTGLSVELLKLMWEKMGYPEQKIEVKEWNRAYNLTLNPEPDKFYCLFATSRTKSREKLFKWVSPINTHRISLIALKKSNIKISSLEEMKEYTIGTLRNDVSENMLKEKGFPIEKMDRATSTLINLKKLNGGRFPLMCYSENFEKLVKDSGFDPSKYEIVFHVNETAASYAFSKNVPDTIIMKYQQALDDLEQEKQALKNSFFEN